MHISETYTRVQAWCQKRSQAGDAVQGWLDDLDDLSLSVTVSELGSRLDEVGRAAPAEPLLQSLGSRGASDGTALDEEAGLEHSLADLDESPSEAPTVQAAPAPRGSRYEVMHALKGGMAVVYICFDHAHDFPFAIKTFREDIFLGREETLPAFLREATVWTDLDNHPNIVRAFGTRLIGKAPYLFMEFVSGGTLKELLEERGRLALPDAVRVGRQVCRALRHAARVASGFVHRDLKPSNILLQQGVVQVSDFGLARFGLTDHVADGGFAGTPPYMAPEQWQRSGRLSERTDVYALGLILYEVLSGERPFTCRTARAYREAHAERQPPPLASELAPPALRAVLTRCLAKDPADRPGLRELQRALELTTAATAPSASALVRSPRPLDYMLAYLPGWLTGYRSRRRVRGALGFGQAFSGGVDHAIRRQLRELKGQAVDEALLQRLLALSRLYDQHQVAFVEWSASSLDFDGFPLTGRVLDRLRAPEAQLARCDLSGARLAGADLTGAVLAGSRLAGANLIGACLRRAELRGADLEGACLVGADLQGADLEEAGLRCATLLHARLNRAALRWADLEGARLGRASLAVADLTEAKLRGASLVAAKLTGADLRGADLRNADLRESHLTGARLTGALLTGARLQAVDATGEASFRKCDLRGAELEGARLERADFSGARLEGAVMRGARLERAKLPGASLERADLSGARLDRVDLSEASLRDAVLEGADLRGANLHGASLHGANLRGADLRGARLCVADLCAADLTGARLTDADLELCRFDPATKWPAGFRPRRAPEA